MKREKEISIIGGADGPTSIFLAGSFSNAKKPVKERIRNRVYLWKKKRVEKKIHANPHTLKQTVEAAQRKYHAVELPKTTRTYKEQCQSAKEGMIFQNKPELLGELAEIKPPDVWNEHTAKEMLRLADLRSRKAASVSDSEMPMDFHVYIIKIKGGRMELQIDFHWELFGMSYSGDAKAMKKLKKLGRRLYCFYGVSAADMENKSERYRSLVAALSG